ncbi:glycosyltransferase, partial [Escherichia coli]|nr:glycosyltransferase [Escherichia coli]
MKYLKNDVVIVIPQLGKGGGEKVACNLANAFSRRGINATLLVYKNNSSNDYKRFIDDSVNVVYLDFDKKISRSPIKFIYKLIRNINTINPTTVIFCSGTVNCIVSFFLWGLNKSIKKIARETNLPSLYSNILLRKLYGISYHKFDEIIVQSKEMYNDINAITKCKKKQIKLINNPLELDRIKEYREEYIDVPLFNKHAINIVTAGRLTYQKGYDLLIMMVSNLVNLSKDIGFHILGAGELSDELRALVLKLNLADYIHFYGNVENPYPYYKKADAFVSSSRWEGFPNAVIECLACGTPVIANHYPGGLTEIITNENGVIIDINDSKSFYEAIKYVVNLEPQRIENTIKHLDSIEISKLIIKPE